MKKIFSILLFAAMLLSLLSLAGCGEKTVKFGVGSYVYRDNIRDSAYGNDGQIDTSVTVAAVLIDADGKIADCAIDATDIEAKFTEKGEAVPLGSLKSKYEQGDSYGMKKAATKGEWYKQVDNFKDLIKGKSIDEVKALVAKDNKGNDEVIKAGCTIEIASFVKALENAASNTRNTDINKKDVVKIAMASSQTKNRDATDSLYGEVTVDVSFAATVLDNKSTVVKAFVDSVEIVSKFNSEGANVDSGAAIISKKSAGASYGMTSGSDLNGDGKVLEWYEQAELLEKAMVGKTASGINKLVGDKGYGDSDLQSAGCTIKISSLSKAAAKAAK